MWAAPPECSPWPAPGPGREPPAPPWISPPRGAPPRRPADNVVVSDEDHRYLVRVLRLAGGDAVTLFDGRGGEADATIPRLGPRALELHIEARRESLGPHGPELTLIQ